VAVGARHEARERVLGLLYEAAAKGSTPSAVLADLPVPPEAFVADAVCGVERDTDRIDRLIGEHSVGWGIDRMPVVDRSVLRMATWELLSRPDIPTGVVISEAVELAKAYSTEDSGRFVNGVLAAVAAEVRGSHQGSPPSS
jgi:transcription antitermination protein NusB